MNTSITQQVEDSERTRNQRQAVAAASGFLAIAIFQAALAIGAPLGNAAYGGNYEQLPIGLRIASAFAVGFWVLATLIILGRGGFKSPLPAVVLRRGTWALIGVSGVGALLNFASQSNWERYLWGPLALVLAILCFKVARNDSNPLHN